MYPRGDEGGSDGPSEFSLAKATQELHSQWRRSNGADRRGQMCGGGNSLHIRAVVEIVEKSKAINSISCRVVDQAKSSSHKGARRGPVEGGPRDSNSRPGDRNHRWGLCC